ncbi:putative bifunctional diguanylate cyclase/phosphodiesterase [Arenimonas composti]|nr:EAL domain-containing protein [Arenimonas composti]
MTTLLMALVVVGIALPLADAVIGVKFGAFEVGKARDDADRLQLLLSERMERLRAQVVDYAEWVDAVDYMRGADNGFIAENITADGMDNFGVDRVFVLGPALEVRDASELVLPPGRAPKLQALPAERLRPVLADSRVRGIHNRRGGRAFLMPIDGEWFLVAVAAVIDPNDLAGSRDAGVIGFASAISGRRGEEIEAVAKLPLRLTTEPAGPLGSRLDGDEVHTVRRLLDSDGEPTAWLDLHHPRPLAAQTRIARILLLAMAVGIFVVGSLLVWQLVDRRLIRRLERMHAELDALAGGRREALAVSGAGDEIDALAGRFNLLVGELGEVSRRWAHEASHDALTGLGNRASLLRTLDAEGHGDTAATLLLVDLDGFKAVNELFGHALGDHVLTRVAHRLREADLAADAWRIGGDEFALRLPGADPEHALATAARLREAVAGLALSGVARGVLHACVGVALREPGQALRGEEFLQRAEVALHAAKTGRSGGIAMFDAAMLLSLQEDAALARALDRAILDGGIEPWFQPIVAAADGRVRGFEVLARWRHRDAGWIAPARFIAVAERNHLAAGVDRLVLRQALQALPRLQAAAPGVGLSVNASAQSLLDGSYIEAVSAMLGDAPALAPALTLEITETAFSENEQALVPPVEALRGLGVRVVLDDFGVGHSSLARLAHLRPAGIKLDGAFVRQRRDGGDRICRAVIGLAHEFDIAVTAEWIETAEDAACLRDWKCDTLQGNHFAAPMPLAATLAWMQEPLRA